MTRPEEPRVRAIYTACHPDQPERPSEWYIAYPTLVVMNDHRIVGFTSCSISPGPTGTLTLYGNDLCVLPMFQKCGVGWALAEARLDLGRAVGATTFIGITEVSNTAMIRIFERQHLHACQRLPGYFGRNDGMAWVGTI